jgi:hypothetical protein
MSKLRVFVVAALAASAFALMPTATAAAASPEGLWDTDVVPTSFADGRPVADFGSVELGVKFETSKPIYVVGVRFYRDDAGTWSGSLWNANGGTWITSADDSTSGPGWQTAMFGSPQAMAPGDTFVASYFAPGGAYAFEWNYFTAPRTVGPVTALGGAGVNGLFTYGPTSTFPTGSFRDTNYWVTPLWVPQYTLSGFYRPVDMGGVFNTVKGGSTVPLKFEVFDSATGMEQTDVAVVDRFDVTPITCPNGNPTTDDVESTTTGGTSLRYDFTEGQFIQNWKTPKTPGKCYVVTLTTDDGTSISAYFKMK